MATPVPNLLSYKSMKLPAPSIMLLGPSLSAVSGISTHLNQLFNSRLAEEFTLCYFQVGSQGRNETQLSKFWRFAFSPAQFIWQLVVKNPQIVHVNTVLRYKSYWRDLVYLMIALAMGKKVVYQVHGGALPACFFRNRLLTLLLRRMLNMVDVVVLISNEQLHAYRNFSSSLNLIVIPNAIEPGPDPIWKNKNQDNGQLLHIAYVGRFIETKGLFELVEALAMLIASGTQVRLLLAGDGPDEKRLRTRVDELGLTHVVQFLGVVSGAEKDHVWQNADLFALPSYTEGLPYALLESMAFRTPPLVTPVGGIPDVVQNGIHGMFVSSRDPTAIANAIRHLNNDRSLICRMGDAGRKRIESYYFVDRLAQDFQRIYFELSGAKTTDFTSP